MNYLPDWSDIDEEDLADLATNQGDLDGLSLEIEESGKKLKSLLMSDQVTRELIQAAEQEYLEYCRLRLVTMTGPALEGLEAVLQRKVHSKKAMSVVKAAEAVLDRGAFPKQSRVTREQHSGGREKVMPSLDELVEGVSSDEATDIVRKYKDVLHQVDELRQGARQIIDVQTQEQEKQVAESDG